MRVSFCLFILVCLLFTNFFVIADQDSALNFSKDSNSSSISNNELIQNNVNEMISESPMIFTENQGQLENDQVRYYANGGMVWFTDDGVWFEIREEIKNRGQGSEVRGQESRTHILPHLHTPPFTHSQTHTQKYRRVILKQEFVGGNLVRPEGRERTSWNGNFFYGNDSTKWCTEVPNYMEVYYENLYDGIDLRYYTNKNGLKYDFIVHPGANVQQIRIKYMGIEKLEVDEFGNLKIITELENIVDTIPIIYQTYGGIQNQINGNFKLYGPQEYGFRIIQDYNRYEDLVIDPNVKLEYSTYIGGDNYDYGFSITPDDSGNAYLTGRTKSTDFPTTPGAYNNSYNNYYDIFVTKVNPTGTNLVYSTYIGGAEDDIGYDIALDKSGNAFVTGETDSSDFPVTQNVYDTSKDWSYNALFVLKLDQYGSNILYSTFIEGNNPDYGYGIAVDPNGNAIVTGYTLSWTFPTTPNVFNQSFSQYSDIFVLKLNQTGKRLVYSTYVGGRYWDYAYDVAIDTQGNAFITGYTSSDNFPTTSGAFNKSYSGALDCIVFKINQTGKKLIYSTYVGSSSTDIGYGISIDSFGYAYVTGYTRSANFPITPNAFDTTYNGGTEDAFIFKLNQTGSKFEYSTFIGDTSSDWGYDIEVDSIGSASIVGTTYSNNFPRTPDAYDNSYGAIEGYLLKLAPNGTSLIYSTFLGGSWTDDAKSIALDSVGNAYMIGYTESSDFPTSPGAFNKSKNSNSDLFVSKFAFTPVIRINSLDILQEEKTTSYAFSQLCPYTFRINLVDTASLTDLNKVFLTLDPIGSNIQLSWTRETNQFSELSDPNDFISIDSSSNGRNLFNMWTIDFNITFNWDYPDEDFHDIQVQATSFSLSPAWSNFSAVYQVENDLCFNGTLTVENEIGKRLSQNELVRGGEKLTWTGLTPVYEGTIDVYPPEDEFDIAICDDCDNTWICSPNTGEQLYTEIFTPNTSFPNYNYTLNICGIPPECDNTSEMFTLRIDADNLKFSEIIPNDKTWQTTDDVTVGVTITDFGGGVVNSSTVRYAISRNNGTSWDSWETVPNLESTTSMEVRDIVSLRDGKNNLIRWKATDSVGNGPIESEPSRILVDTEGIRFYNAWPSVTAVSTSELVEFGITIADGISGVNASTIKYSISKDGGKSWEAWVAVEGYDDKKSIDVHINQTFPNGTNNMIKWRATDVAGNTAVESPPYTINVNTWTPAIKPVVRLVSPLNAMVINKTEVELMWELEDTHLKDVKYDVCLDKVNPPGEYRVGLTNTSFTANKLLDGMTYYWRIVSRYGDDISNTYKSDVWWFKIDLGAQEKDKIFKLKITGPDRISMKQGENRTVQISITNLGNIDDRVDLELQAGLLYGVIEIEDYSILEIRKNGFIQVNLKINIPLTILPGEYKLEIVANSLDSGGIVSTNHTIILDVQPLELEPTKVDDDQDKSNQWLFLILPIILVIIILLVGVFLFYYNRKKHRDQELQAGRTITTKPLPSQVINVGELPQPQVPQVVAIPTQQPMPRVITAGTQPQPQALTTPSPTIAPQPTIAQPSQVMPVPRVVQSAQVPQLPPAMPETQTTQYDSLDVPGGEVTIPPETVPEPTHAQDTQSAQTRETPVMPSQPSLAPTISPEPPETQEGQNQNSTTAPTVSLPDQKQTSNKLHLPGGTEPKEHQEQQTPTLKDPNETNDA